MAENTEMVQKQTEIVENANSCSGCGSKINAKADRINKDPIADGLLRLCAIINGTWDDILASIQSISFLREVALYIDCTILAVWKRKKNKQKQKNR
jgi:hypothetical protein